MSKKVLSISLVMLVAVVFVFAALSLDANATPDKGGNCFDAGCHNSDMSLQKPSAPAQTEPAPKAEPAKQAQPQPKPAANIVSKTMNINGQSIEAIVVKDVTLVPVRDIGNFVDAQVTWDGNAKSVTVVSGAYTVALTIDKDTASVNGQEQRLLVEAQIYKDKAMAPIRFIGEALGLDVNYTDQAITIKKANVLGLNKDKALQGYAGAEKCKTCHPATYKDWMATDHATMLQKADPQGYMVANFATNEYFNFEDVLYMVNQGQRFVGEKDGTLQYLPATWNEEKGIWEEGSWRDYAGCAGCHTAGFNAETGNWADNGISCESCHGPGAEHVKAPSKDNIQTSLANETCSGCHGEDRQGAHMEQQLERREGIGHLGIFEHASVAEADRYWDSNCFRCHSASYMVAQSKGETPPTKEDFLTGSLQDDREGITCVVCHDPHKRTAEGYQLRKSPLETCTQCHQSSSPITLGREGHHNQMEVFNGLYFKADGTEGKIENPKAGISCADCHMTDGNHTWEVGTPIIELTSHGQPYDADSCGSCHNGMTQEKIEAFQVELEEKYEALVTEKDAVKALYDAVSAEKQAAAKAYLDVAVSNLAMFYADKSNGIHNTGLFEVSFAETEIALAEARKVLK